MPRIDIAAVAARKGSGYPVAFREAFANRLKQPLGDAVGLTQFGVNLTTLPPNVGTALRHWHENEDEFVFVLKGELVLIEDEGETVLRAGDAAGFKAGVSNGHCIVNRSSEEAVILEVGTRAATERAHYPDVDLAVVKDETGFRWLHKSGEPYA